MADYNGTDGDDIIDASELASDVNNIYPGKGNDTVTNATSRQTIISSPGEDNISGSNFAYALWQATQGGITINLKEGWSDDGFGGKDLSQEEKDHIYNALLTYKVIFFRDQDISTEQHMRFGQYFGELEIHPFAPLGTNREDHPEVLRITHNEDNKPKENAWHSDVTWRMEPSLGSILRMVETPSVGGDTLFANMEAAYENLPDEIKEKLEGAFAVHDFALFRNRLIKQGKSPEEIEEFNKKFPKPTHPVIRTHPDTGKKSIYVNVAFTTHIEDFSDEDSRLMLNFLYNQATIPEYQCRFKWEENSIAFWDNRACQHYATGDYWPAVRRVERVTVIGNKPV